MVKKLFFTSLVAILITLSAVSLVSAEDQFGNKQLPDTHPNRRALVGQVMEIGISEFEVEIPNGNVISISITEKTVFRSRQDEQGEEASFSDLEVGMWVAVYLKTDDPDTTNARLVVLLPDDIDPSNLRGRRVLGEVDKINPGQNTFEVLTRNGETISFQVDEKTRFGGGIDSFDDLEKGMVVAVLAVKQEDNSLLAKLVSTREQDRPRLQKTRGKITEIGDSSITVLLTEGEEKTFTITEDTRFASRKGDIHGLEDLKLDMVVAIVTRPDSEQALAVMVADQALLELERVRGTVQSAGGDHLTINVGDEKLQFTVHEKARIRGRGIEDLNDLKNGMKVLVLYTENDGELIAAGILVAAPNDNGK
jgi:hypothetical protein